MKGAQLEGRLSRNGVVRGSDRATNCLTPARTVGTAPSPEKGLIGESAHLPDSNSAIKSGHISKDKAGVAILERL